MRSAPSLSLRSFQSRAAASFSNGPNHCSISKKLTPSSMGKPPSTQRPPRSRSRRRPHTSPLRFLSLTRARVLISVAVASSANGPSATVWLIPATRPGVPPTAYLDDVELSDHPYLLRSHRHSSITDQHDPHAREYCRRSVWAIGSRPPEPLRSALRRPLAVRRNEESLGSFTSAIASAVDAIFSSPAPSSPPP